VSPHPTSANGGRTRRAFLASCSLAAAGGCTALGTDGPDYQIVGGVEWKSLHGTRDDTVEQIAENTPVNGPVVDAAPVDLELRTVAYDTAVVDLSGPGPLALSESTLDRLEDGYEDPFAVVVLTLYNQDPHNEVPKGNSFGYRTSFEAFNEVDPGDRISATVDRDREVVAIAELLTVDRADTGDERS